MVQKSGKLTSWGNGSLSNYLPKNWVVVSNIFYFHPHWGKISNLTNIFQMGWNHQPVIHAPGGAGFQPSTVVAVIVAVRQTTSASGLGFNNGIIDEASVDTYMGVSKNRGTPKWMVKIRENHIKMDDLEGKPTIFGNIHILGLAQTKDHYFRAL